jgi:uncharacterized protein (DUF736 family)|tara:strand:- start:141 stop:506 length:366 start_codon:yes stop_codon:yes gene_type:complete
MAEYDDTNRGAAFTPFPTQQMILQGKVNVEGVDSKVVLVKDQTKDGRGIVEVYQKMAVMFDNDKKGNDAAPDYSGPVGEEKRIAGWRRMKDGKPYMSFQISDKQQGQQSASSSLPEDSIPF